MTVHSSTPDDLLDFARLADVMAHRLRVCGIRPELADAFQRYADEHREGAA